MEDEKQMNKFNKILNLLNSFRDYTNNKRKRLHDRIIECDTTLSNVFIHQGSLDQQLEKFDHFGLNTSKRKDHIIVSITSMPSRYWMLPYSLYGLMNQVEKPDRIILTLYGKDFDILPDNVKRFERYGLEYKIIDEDLKRGKKMFPLFETEEDDTIILFGDDDLYYEPLWLKTLYEGYNHYKIPCYYLFGRYVDPKKETMTCVSNEYMPSIWNVESRCPLMIPLTGIGFILSLKDFHSDIRKREIANKFKMMNDDEVFLYCVSKLNRLRFQKIRFDFLTKFCDLAFPSNNFRQVIENFEDCLYREFASYYGFSSLREFALNVWSSNF